MSPPFASVAHARAWRDPRRTERQSRTRRVRARPRARDRRSTRSRRAPGPPTVGVVRCAHPPSYDAGVSDTTDVSTVTTLEGSGTNVSASCSAGRNTYAPLGEKPSSPACERYRANVTRTSTDQPVDEKIESKRWDRRPTNTTATFTFFPHLVRRSSRRGNAGDDTRVDGDAVAFAAEFAAEFAVGCVVGRVRSRGGFEENVVAENGKSSTAKASCRVAGPARGARGVGAGRNRGRNRPVRSRVHDAKDSLRRLVRHGHANAFDPRARRGVKRDHRERRARLRRLRRRARTHVQQRTERERRRVAETRFVSIVPRGGVARRDVEKVHERRVRRRQSAEPSGVIVRHVLSRSSGDGVVVLRGGDGVRERVDRARRVRTGDGTGDGTGESDGERARLRVVARRRARIVSASVET